ncbi:PREDICTED: transcriptional regulator ATRX homolog [Amphimedon queenslandica]|uniref:BOD1/SHG1 domain-containing protein n=1 Tax=Amphimedon queenslandica TaxID=400682 RepID=A0A1X7VHM6_AMPQE|nr:PREDICTED: transcriptional regulator ATRX homolog [Amphimedon queenslandica]|eukprot:XP_019848947.1 PREDICTED: transcriptional regulator ATRX homolog [Amphimedon queenslandica]
MEESSRPLAEPLAPLPLVQDVLERLKFDGTFDQFRKTCLSAIEEEPSYRAQKEHVEVLSRRFLHDYETKEMTKNDVRTKLRLSVLEEIKKPGVQASQTMEELVDKTLESKSGELFKKILDIVDNMLHPPEPHPPNDTSILNSSHQPTGISTLSDPTPPTSVAGTGLAGNTFELPIDLLSFSSGSSSSNLKKEAIKKIAGKGKLKPNEGTTISGKELQKKAGKVDLPGEEGLLSVDKEKIKKQKMEKTDTNEKEHLETQDTQVPSSNEGREKEENVIERDDAKIEPTLLDMKKDLTLLENKSEDALHTEEESEEKKETEADKGKGVEDRNNGIEDVFEDENFPPLSNSRPRRSARLASQQQQEEEKEEEELEEELEEEEEEENKEKNHGIEEKEMEQEEEEKNKNERTRRKRKKRISQSEQDEEEEEEKGRKRHPRKKQRLQPVRSSGRVKKRLLSSTSSEDKQSHDECHVSSSKKSDSPQPMSPSVKEKRMKVASRGSKTEDTCKIESEDDFDEEPKRIETKGRRSKRSRNKQ